MCTRISVFEIVQNMERYSGTQAMEAVQVDPVAEWAAPGGETGLEGELHFNFI